MNSPQQSQSCMAVTVAEAAGIMGRSKTWIRTQLVLGQIDIVPNADGGPMRISRQSIVDFVERQRTERLAREASSPATAKPRHLSLVIDNGSRE